MKKVQYVEMSDSEHGLKGIGDISYKYTYDKGEHSLIITLLLLNQEINYKGIQAKKIYNNMLKDTDKETIELVKRLACDAVGIPVIRLSEETRKKEVVWARYMTAWYINSYMGYSLAAAGQAVGIEHATVIHGKKEFNKLNREMKEYQIISKSVFLKKCVSYQLLT